MLPSHLKPFATMTEAEFLGKPVITKDANGADLRPSELKSHAGLAHEGFMEKQYGDRYSARFSDKGCTVYDREKKTKVVASYDNFGKGSSTLVVDKAYRRLGIGSEMIYQWRIRHPEAAVASTRTKKSQALQKNVWARIHSELKLARVSMLLVSEGVQSVEPLRP